MKNFNPHEILSQVMILHHTDSLLARKITKAVLLERVKRGDFKEPAVILKTDNGVLHVSI